MINTKFPKGVEVVGSAIIENPKGEILLTKSPKWNNKWIMPGGHIDPGESIEQAIIREAEEESGLKVKSLGIISYGELIDSKDFSRPAHFIYFSAYCTSDNYEVKLDNDELVEYAWVSPEDALKMDMAGTYAGNIKDFIKFKKSL